MTQSEFAKMIGISKQAVNALLSTKNKKDHYVARLARFALYFSKEEFERIESKINERFKDGNDLLEEDGLITAKDAAAILGVNIETLTVMRSRKKGPPYLKIDAGNKNVIRYRQKDIIDWITSRKKGKSAPKK